MERGREKERNNKRTQDRKEKERGEEKKGWVKRNKLVKKTNSFLFKAPSIDNSFQRPILLLAELHKNCI